MNVMTNITNLTQKIARSPGDPQVLKSGPSSLGAPDRLARALGWFSLGLGAYELFAARRLAGTLGMEGKEGLIRAYGAREIGAGIMSLSVDSSFGIANRLVGDAIDVATLMPALGRDNPKRDNAVTALALVLGVTALDMIAYGSLKKRHARVEGQARDYSDRTGFPGGVEAARGAALDSFETPVDFRVVPPMADQGERPTTH